MADSTATFDKASLPKPPPYWGTLPGYGEAIADPKRIPPYEEDLGGGATFKVEPDGTQKWRMDGYCHRDNDLPAVIRPDGTQEWWQHGYRNRDGDKPALVWADGTQEWYRDSCLHRDNDLPAVVHANGTLEWYRNGKRHRDGGKPAITSPDGSCKYCYHGELRAAMLSSGKLVV